ncbi:DAK2 domain-containing protein [Mangrovihabitans endophyticus]|uniref:Dihydroxyacetone kinase n=1 Tax=Mangrovihabitans endophyticus TaxID=1751298 RepID=A0A8J3FRE1_9ACTN|nr:DAK2 domain-containing protein [Mangrovihabitans endophyticus]GGL10888.1 dihydroxyacetone kinase [Mangrovihabitans endophyticus]
MLDALDVPAVRRWCRRGLASLRAHQREIDELNVYPVPDGDTGTNLVLTLTSASEALSDPEPSDVDASGPQPTPLGRAMRRMARGALLGARGNSGVIVSQILRGMADTLATPAAVRGGELAVALRTASEAAYAAVARPVEGTVLSVVAAAADAAVQVSSNDLIVTARAAARAAADALARTPQQLPDLARAGVVDAGGRGLVLLLDALVEALKDEPEQDGGAAAERKRSTGQPHATRPADNDRPADDALCGPGAVADFGYEVQYLLDATPPAVALLREELDRIGDSVVVVGTGEGSVPTWNVHVHTPDVGAAVEAGVEAGRPHRIVVTRLEDGRHPPDDDPLDDAPSDDVPPDHAPPDHAPPDDTPSDDASSDDASSDGAPARAAVVVAAGDGLTALFAAEGATVVDRNPSPADLLEAVRATGAVQIVLLPNDANTLAVATVAAREASEGGTPVSVVPTRSPVQALAALAVRDAQRPFAEDVIAMAEAAGACRYGEVCTAHREALTMAGRCRPGDLLGLLDGEVHVIGRDMADVCRSLLDRMLGGGGELVTLVLGADAPSDLEQTLRTHVSSAWPFAEIQCYTGGQPRYHLLVGVE